MITLLIAVPLALAFATIPLRKLARLILPVVVLANLVILFALKPHVGKIIELGSWPAVYGITLFFDEVAFYFLSFVNMMFLVISLITRDERFSIPLLVMNAALNGLILTADFFNSFVFLEIIAITSYIISTDKDNALGSFKYLIFGGVASIFYLIGAVFMYVQGGTLNMAYSSYIIGMSNPELMKTALVLFAITLLVELKVLPFGLWVPDVYGNGSALTPVVLGSVVSTATVYLFSRLSLTFVDEHLPPVFYYTVLASIVLSQLGALYQKNLGRTLAFASMASMSTVVASLLTRQESVVSTALFYLFTDALAKFVLFTVYGNLGVANFRNAKTTGIAFTFSSLSLVGVPIFAGFWGKYYLLKALFEQENYVLAIVVLVSTLIELAYVTKWNIEQWFAKKETTKGEIENIDLPFVQKLFVLLSALILLVIGLFPQLLLDKTNLLAEKLFDFQLYRDIFFGKGGM
uniref:Na+/H+ antiporter subunit D n=1 Tax=Fervidobacterium thailandense TaxID=1008305 RepID=A0A7C4W2V9_9BACT